MMYSRVVNMMKIKIEKWKRSFKVGENQCEKFEILTKKYHKLNIYELLFIIEYLLHRTNASIGKTFNISNVLWTINVLLLYNQ